MSIESEFHSRKNDEISLKDLFLKLREWWRYLLSKWIFIAVFGILGAALGLVYAFVKKPVYTATTTFVLEDEKSGASLGNLAGLASMAGVDLGGSGGGIFQGDNILQLYKSRMMLEKTLLTPVDIDGKKVLLVERYIQINKLWDKWRKETDILKLNFADDSANRGRIDLKSTRLRDSVMSLIVDEIGKKYLAVLKPDKKMSTIQVDVSAKDEFFAKRFNDELVANVNEFYIQTKTKKTIQNVRILQNKTDSVRRVMNGAIYKAVAVSDATPNLNPTREIQRTAPAQKAQFSAETNKAILAELVKNLEMSKISLLKETPLIQVIDSPIYPLRKTKVGFLTATLLFTVFSVFLAVFFLTIKRFFSFLADD